MTRAANKGGVEFYLHGFDLLTTHIKHIAALSAMIAYVPEKGVMNLLTDDRLANYASEFKADMEGELEWLGGLPLALWGRLVTLVGDGASTAGARGGCLWPAGSTLPAQVLASLSLQDIRLPATWHPPRGHDQPAIEPSASGSGLPGGSSTA